MPFEVPKLTKIKIRQDSAGRLAFVEILERGKPLAVTYTYFKDSMILDVKGKQTASNLDLLRMIDAKFTERIAVVEKQPQMEDLTREAWMTDGSYTERWEQGFRRILYHGRTGAYFKSESAKNTLYKDWTLPDVLPNGNTIGTAPWHNALRMKSQHPVTGSHDEIYVGFPKAHHRQFMAFEAKLQGVAGATPDLHAFGFEVNSGGSYAYACFFGCLAGQYQLNAMGHRRVGVSLNANVTLNYPDAWARYMVWHDPPFFEVWQSTVADVNVLERAAILDLQEIRGKGIPFICNEDAGTSEFQVGDIWISELENPRPKRFKTKTGRINATALLGLKETGFLVKIHSFTLNSESDGQTAYFYEETSGDKIGLSMPLNAREGYSVAHTLIQTLVLGKDIGLNLAGATFVNYTVEYSVDDWA